MMADAQNDDGAGEVRLQQHKACNGAQHQQKGQHAVAEGFHFFVIEGHNVRKQCNNCELGNF